LKKKIKKAKTNLNINMVWTC